MLSSHQRESTLAALAETGLHHRKHKIGKNWFPFKSNAPNAYSVYTLVFIQPPSDSDVADAQGQWDQDTASEVAMRSQTSQLRLCPLSLGCSDTSRHLPTSTLGRDTVYCQENPCRDLKSRYLVTCTVPQNLLAGGTFVTTGPGTLEVQMSHSIAFVGDNSLSHFASLSCPSQLPTRGHPENIVALWRT